MGRQFQPSRVNAWQAGSETAWLSMLIDTMEAVSRPELRTIPCDQLAMAALRAQLALPASARYTSSFGLRH